MMKNVIVSGWFFPTFVQIIRWYRCHNLPQITWLHKSTNINANMWLRQRNLSPPLTYFHRWLYLHIKLLATTSQTSAATSLPQRFLTMIKPRKQILTGAWKKWMKSSVTIAASSACKHEILTDRLNKIHLRSIDFYFCSKQTMDVFLHCTFAWINVDFSCKTAFISYHVMSARLSRR